MKKTLIISLLCLASAGSYAQIQYTVKDAPPLENNGQGITVTPSFTAPYKVVADEPCYMYKKNGEIVMNCPDVWVYPQESSDEKIVNEPAVNVGMEMQNSYSGYYNYKADPSMPANAVPVRPTATPYKLFQDPPCYQYTTKKGLVVMECHGLWFPPENKK